MESYEDYAIGEKLLLINCLLDYVEGLLADHPNDKWSTPSERMYANGWSDALLKIQEVLLEEKEWEQSQSL